MKAFVEFIPRHFEKALDLARHIATFGCIEFIATGAMRMRVIDPAKVVYMDFELVPETFKLEEEFTFGIHLGMFYKLVKSLDNDQKVEIEVMDNVMKINQCERFHTILSQEVPFSVPQLELKNGPTVRVGTKLLQKYVRTMANISAVVELNLVPASDTLFLESVNSIYRTLFSINAACPDGEEYRKQFMVKFVEMGIHPGLGDQIDLVFLEDSLRIYYGQPNMHVVVIISAYTEG